MFEEELAECHFKDGAGRGPCSGTVGERLGEWPGAGQGRSSMICHRKAQGAEAEQMFSLEET